MMKTLESSFFSMLGYDCCFLNSWITNFILQICFSFDEKLGRRKHVELIQIAETIPLPKFFMNWWIMERGVKNSLQADKIIDFVKSKELFDVDEFLQHMKSRSKSPGIVRTVSSNSSSSQANSEQNVVTPMKERIAYPKTPTISESSREAKTPIAITSSSFRTPIHSQSEASSSSSSSSSSNAAPLNGNQTNVTQGGGARRLSNQSKKKFQRLPAEFITAGRQVLMNILCRAVW